MTTWRRCLCACHQEPDAPEYWTDTVGVNANDALHGYSCCSKCRWYHDPKFIAEPVRRAVPFDVTPPFEPPRPADATGDGEYGEGSE